MGHSIAVDTGGTFTDLVAVDQDGRLGVAKALSTPQDPSQAVFSAISKAGLDPKGIGYFVFGTTVATNMLLERKGARVGLITTRGFRDLLRIQRVLRPSSFDLHWVKPQHLVPRALCLEVAERIDAHGEVVCPLDESDVRAAVGRLRSEGVEAIAVSFLFSFLNPTHERSTRDLICSLYPRPTFRYRPTSFLNGESTSAQGEYSAEG